MQSENRVSKIGNSQVQDLIQCTVFATSAAVAGVDCILVMITIVQKVVCSPAAAEEEQSALAFRPLDECPLGVRQKDAMSLSQKESTSARGSRRL